VWERAVAELVMEVQWWPWMREGAGLFRREWRDLCEDDGGCAYRFLATKVQWLNVVVVENNGGCRGGPWLTVVECEARVSGLWERWKMMMWHHLIVQILSCWIMTHVNMWLDIFEN